MSAINKDRADQVFDNIQKFKNQIGENLKEKALQLNNSVNLSQWGLTELLHDGYVEFATRVHKEYDDTSNAQLAEIFISPSKIYFYGHLNKEITQLIKNLKQKLY